jgi:ribosomal protein L11 methylase PrmA
MTGPSGVRIIHSLNHLSRCTFEIFYYDSLINESICVNCLIEEPLIIRKNYKRKTRHSVVISNILNLQTCDICSKIITLCRPAFACSSCKEILSGFLSTRNLHELTNTYNSAQADPVVIIHRY